MNYTMNVHVIHTGASIVNTIAETTGISHTHYKVPTT
jgi:hypothetical protein